MDFFWNIQALIPIFAALVNEVSGVVGKYGEVDEWLKSTVC